MLEIGKLKIKTAGRGVQSNHQEVGCKNFRFFVSSTKTVTPVFRNVQIYFGYIDRWGFWAGCVHPKLRPVRKWAAAERSNTAKELRAIQANDARPPPSCEKGG